MAEIAIEVSDELTCNQLEQIGRDENSFSSERRGMDGLSLFTVVMTLAPLVIDGIIEIIEAQIKAKKHVRVLIDGIEIRGVSEKTLLKILASKNVAETPK
ncbi:hypothetical protein ATH90_0203 [Pseudomonas lurida]|uniref:Uncharacterized protein n=1 Tax=Pseudomonas lurida TaxID=244566 RepID=A0ABY9FV73_9PSED|nr:hypothetical protein [Pseudomonas lurida]PFG21528.1 hypothetical protein ATH90_0203 [Pseudomonas lurida]WLH07248.1 hypothetical protein PSH67_00895 [Pseudomonas lurida]